MGNLQAIEQRYKISVTSYTEEIVEWSVVNPPYVGSLLSEKSRQHKVY